MTTRYQIARCFVFFVVLISASVAQAQGTVAWSQGYPKGVDTVGPPMPQFGKILVKGTQAPAPGWSYAGAIAEFRNNAGGGIPQPGIMDEKNGDLGKLDPNTGNIVELIADGFPKGNYTVWIKVFYQRPLPGGPPGVFQVVPITSPIPPAVVIN